MTTIEKATSKVNDIVKIVSNNYKLRSGETSLYWNLHSLVEHTIKMHIESERNNDEFVEKV